MARTRIQYMSKSHTYSMHCIGYECESVLMGGRVQNVHNVNIITILAFVGNVIKAYLIFLN